MGAGKATDVSGRVIRKERVVHAPLAFTPGAGAR
jgi:hypothetical protein